ncbi:ribosomal protein S18 acetylase RimI-like enzyme [Rheinheimera pacifica]|uniref:GNAT family N-acetyltransferase n=1 Tax=Rheinheimera pacifica TaxID=173990 RepID=UPI00285E41C6|nr:GNAT family N-acetyltransferase [Rheinheimera pacifica]MDR6982219.1 ribosomal protein S18 acetylase RimI-like enzyme [Rheinheimera pacifica]
MKTPGYITTDQPPTAAEYIALRCKVGWGSIEPNTAQNSLNCSLFNTTVRLDGKLIGMARVVGDGFMYFYIQDVIVDPAHQGCGIGQMLMARVETYLASTCQAGATVGLLAAKGKERFYRRYGFIERDGETLGKGMCRFVSE